jgi:hypothetical protein
MKKNEPPTSDELRPEYDLTAMRARRLGPDRKGFAGLVRLAPDVADIYPTADAVNEALRFLARIVRESPLSAPPAKP